MLSCDYSCEIYRHPTPQTKTQTKTPKALILVPNQWQLRYDCPSNYLWFCLRNYVLDLFCLQIASNRVLSTEQNYWISNCWIDVLIHSVDLATTEISHNDQVTACYSSQAVDRGSGSSRECQRGLKTHNKLKRTGSVTWWIHESKCPSFV